MVVEECSTISTLCSRTSRVKGEAMTHIETGGQRALGCGHTDASGAPMCPPPTGTHPWYLTVKSWIHQKFHTTGHAWCPVVPGNCHLGLLQFCNGLVLFVLHLLILSHRGSRSSSHNGNYYTHSPSGCLLTCDPAMDLLPLVVTAIDPGDPS
jgi:hypothetical protein